MKEANPSARSKHTCSSGPLAPHLCHSKAHFRALMLKVRPPLPVLSSLGSGQSVELGAQPWASWSPPSLGSFLWPFSLLSASSSGPSFSPLIREINPEYSLEGLMLKLKFQYFGHLMQTDDSLEKALGKIEGSRRRGHQRMDGITDAMNMNLGKLWEMVRNREAWHAAAHRITKSQT